MWFCSFASIGSVQTLPLARVIPVTYLVINPQAPNTKRKVKFYGKKNKKQAFKFNVVR